MNETNPKKHKLVWTVVGILLFVTFWLAVLLFCFALWREKPSSFFDDAAVWKGDGFELETYGDVSGGYGYRKNAEGTVTLDGVTNEVTVYLFKPENTASVYVREGYDYSQKTDNDERCLFELSVEVSLFHKDRTVFEIKQDYLSERDGTTDHTGEKFTLYRQETNA